MASTNRGLNFQIKTLTVLSMTTVNSREIFLCKKGSFITSKPKLSDIVLEKNPQAKMWQKVRAKKASNLAAAAQLISGQVAAVRE